MHALVVTVVRPFTAEDTFFVRRVAAEAFAEYDAARAAAHTLSLVQSPNARTLIAEHDGRPVGFAIVAVEGDYAHLSAVAVVRGLRGRGIGGKLVRAAERNAVVRGARVMLLETGEANLAAIDLFVRSGYQRDGRVARYYRTGYDALRFRKALGARAV
jgi:ribosomal-protein-alanine N-acetyltransferase